VKCGAYLEQEIRTLAAVNIWLPVEKKVPTDSDLGQKKVILLAGPTACGKTEISLLLAESLNGEIISADSMQVYRGMDLGTAKATLEQRRQVAHHLIDIRDIQEPFNVVDFYYAARQACCEIQGRGKVPIIVGGSGFYFHTLLYGPPAGPPSIKGVRDRLEEQMREHGAEEMYRFLQREDPAYAETITMHDRHKIIRALEIIELTGQLVSSYSWKTRAPSMECDFHCWFVHRPRPILYQRVEERCDQMIAAGFIQEVEALEKRGLRLNASAAQAIGYRQCLEYLDSRRTPEDYQRFVEEFKKASRHYVKRQFTWFRQEPLFRWVDVELHDPEVVIDMFVKDCNAF
jgi:tRNA dimethylallyltransferase